MDHQELQKLYSEKREQIQKRLEEFSEIKTKHEREIFAELCFCLLTPQSKARNCWSSILALKASGALYTGRPENIKQVLHKKVRFHNNKAKYIVETRKKVLENGFDWKGFFEKHPKVMREWLVENVKGMGYKEASHFLRNIGFKELAILDRHILKNLIRCGAIDEIPKTLGKNQYLEIEDKFQKFSGKIGISMDELDLLFWSLETGEVFK